MELAAASPVRTAAANFGRRVHSTFEGFKVPHSNSALFRESTFVSLAQRGLPGSIPVGAAVCLARSP